MFIEFFSFFFTKKSQVYCTCTLDRRTRKFVSVKDMDIPNLKPFLSYKYDPKHPH
jgi:hypothetical protein